MSIPSHSTGLLFDCCAASEAIDRSAEILNLKGLDISTFKEGMGVYNYEHKNHKGANNGEEVVGRVVFAKKIFTEKDCDNERQLMYWDKIQVPFLYTIGELFDRSGHSGAQALAAIMRNYHANGQPIVVRASIEGHTLKQEKNRLERCIAKRIALTLSPCNATCETGILSDPGAPEGFDPDPVDLEDIVMTDAQKAERLARGLMPLGKSVRMEIDPVLDGALIPSAVRSIVSAIFKAKILTKAMEAGMATAAPSALVGGGALQKEDVKESIQDLGAKCVACKSPFKLTAEHTDKARCTKCSALKKTYPTTLVCSMESLTIRLREAVSKLQKAEVVTVPEKKIKEPRTQGVTVTGSKPQKEFDLPKLATAPHKFNGKGVWPGEARIRNVAGRMDTHHVIGEHDDNYVVVPNGMLHNYSQSDVKLLPKAGAGTKYVLSREPRFVPPAKVTKEHATNPLINKDQENLISGMDLSNKADKLSGQADDTAPGVSPSQWIKAPNGKDAYVKSEMPADKWSNGGFPHPIREHIYHNMAHNFFGLGNHVTPTVAFKHPETGEPMVASEKVADMQHFDKNNDDHHETLKKLNKSGELDKIGLMNLIMGQADRHGGNYKLSKNGLKLIDHGLSFEKPDRELPPHYWKNDKSNNFYEPLHPAAVKWLKGLDTQKFDEYLTKEGVPLSYRQEAVNRLDELKSAGHFMNRNGAVDIAEGATQDARNAHAKAHPPILQETAR